MKIRVKTTQAHIEMNVTGVEKGGGEGIAEFFFYIFLRSPLAGYNDC